VTGDDDRIAYLAGEGGSLSDPERRADLDELRALLADPSVWAEPGPELEDRLVASIGEEATRTSGLGTQIQQVPSRRRRRRLLIAAGGVAAAVVAAVALTIGLRSNGPTPLHFQAALAGTSLAPGASGDASLTKTNAGWRVVLRATGLPRLDNGQFYQAWLKNQAGTLVPIGTFNQGPTVMLWSGVSPQSFPTITVTEQMAGNPASSGRRVLVGTVDLDS
jgi:Anti-sigma-K factor rskA